jgi:hypothetical protein
MTGAQKRENRGNKSYACGAGACLGLLIREAHCHDLDMQAFVNLLVDFHLTIQAMNASSDQSPPFLTRAMATTLDKAGLEDYETAYQRISNAMAMRRAANTPQV